MTIQTAFNTINRDPKDYAAAFKIARELSRKERRFYSVQYEVTGGKGWDTFGRFVVVPA